MPALDGLRILDMTQYEAGPSCTQALAWLGADVVKIERPGTGDPGRSLAVGGSYSAYFCNWNANKRSVAVDLTRPEGRDLFLRMVRRYDVFIENYGPGVVERLDLEYETLRAIHPSIIYVQLKGFGSSGPYAHYKSYDMVAQAASGTVRLRRGARSPRARPADPPSGHDPADQRRLALRPGVHPLPRRSGPEAHRNDGSDDRGQDLDGPARQPERHDRRSNGWCTRT